MTSKPNSPRRSQRRSDPRTLARFVEELSWLLASYEELDFKALGNMSSEFISFSRSSSDLLSRSRRPPTVHLLVGILPNFLVDLSLFPANEDIVEFAQSALGIGMTRWQKKSRYELIGQIVCHTNEASPAMLERLMTVLEQATDETSATRKKMASDRRSGRSWNEVIQSLVKDYE